MNNKERGKKIRRQIVQDVRHHPTDISKHIAKIFSITPQAVNSHVKRLEKEGWLISSGIGKGKRYFLGDIREHRSLFPLTPEFTEDGVWRNQYSFVFDGLPENIVDICHYGFTEMVNNAIDHSDGRHVDIYVARNKETIMIFIIDDGEGIFKKIKRFCDLHDERQALFELSKGKLTTDPDNHTGEGIFFTSRVFDEFEIDSKGVKFSHNEQSDSRGSFSPSLHNTLHAGPHRAFPKMINKLAYLSPIHPIMVVASTPITLSLIRHGLIEFNRLTIAS
jgi:anti-sigma regulatory factor (Ser/Thr protein kinase)